MRTLVDAQVVLALAMLPALIATIGSVAWIAPLANLVAVPLIGVIVVPLDLMAGVVVVAGMGDTSYVWLTDVADAIVGLVAAYLRVLARLDLIGWHAARGGSAIAFSAIGGCLMVLPLTRRHRILLLPCILLPVIPVQAHLPSGEFEVSVLDVGQGLLVMVDGTAPAAL